LQAIPANSVVDVGIDDLHHVVEVRIVRVYVVVREFPLS
jgi:hypothetical protein